MRERPILFSGPMVRAILDGRKRMTRRVIKPQPIVDAFGELVEDTPCPYGQPGDRLWVRETFLVGRGGLPCYRADGVAPNVGDKWKPSIHMPRAYSRITLEVVSVGVGRVQEISEEDARAEGLVNFPKFDNDFWGVSVADCWESTAKAAFRRLWDSISGKKPGRSWDDNPWVWVVEFKCVSGAHGWR